MSRAADQVSAYGQEPWAQQALADLRRGWPDWAFLVVRYRWLALRGKQAVISATGPQELRHALPPIPRKPDPRKPDPVQPVPERGSPLPALVEHEAPESDSAVLPTLAEVLHGAPGVSWANTSAPPPSASASTPGTHAGVARGGGGAGAGLSGPLTADARPFGVMVAERSVTGTWAVAGADGARVARWQGGWWPWGRGRGRSRPSSRAEEDAPSARRIGPAEGGRRRHRRARPRPAAAAGPVAA